MGCRVDVTRIEMGVSRPRAPLGARSMHLHLSLDTCICRWIHAWVPRVEAGMYYEVRSWRKHPMLSCLTSDQRADQGGAMSLGPGDVSCARVCTCMCIGRGSNAKREVSWVECVSIVVQCNAMCSRVSGLVCVWARIHVPQFTCERRKRAVARCAPRRTGAC